MASVGVVVTTITVIVAGSAGLIELGGVIAALGMLVWGPRRNRSKGAPIDTAMAAVACLGLTSAAMTFILARPIGPAVLAIVLWRLADLVWGGAANHELDQQRSERQPEVDTSDGNEEDVPMVGRRDRTGGPAGSNLDQLVVRAVQGDSSAMTELIRLKYGIWYRLAERLIGDRFEVEDPLQEALLNITLGIYGLRNQTGPGFTSWARTIVKNACIDAIRARQLRPPRTSEANEAEVSFDEYPELRASWQRLVHKFAKRIEPAPLMVVVLRVQYDLTYPQVADEMNDLFRDDPKGWDADRCRYEFNKTAKTLRRLLEEGGAS